MNTTLQFIMGKTTQLIAEFLRCIIIIMILTITSILTVGVGGIIGILYLKFIKSIIPFNISIFNDYLNFLKKEINKDSLIKELKKKAIYNFLITMIVLILLFLNLLYVNNYQDRSIFTIAYIFLLVLELFQFFYLRIVYKSIC